MNENNIIEYENLGKLNAPFFQEYQERFTAMLHKGWFVLGTEVKAFEKEFNYPIADNIHETVLSLPISYIHTEEDVRRVAQAINAFKG